ncbi:hypothetical protein CLV78_103231 [Aliiruegeria haliotis]|uniref:Secreted protein n=1 Tax=Aliiruegeria haliotis TaxID=1280846 RepID=A0A2T0RT39_9RHOB|nr:hypothetical protein [Aliiruegeria haliotis]PRY24365.1 hypothetical protein CLV78_103231 [Aliiruegeria haliotis]
MTGTGFPNAFLAALAGLATLMAVPDRAGAATVTYDYVLTIRKIKGQAQDSPFLASDRVQVIGSFALDPDVADTKPGNASIGLYNKGVLSSAFGFAWSGGSYASGVPGKERFRSQIRNQDGAKAKDRYQFQDKSTYGALGDYSFNFLRITLLDKAKTGVFTNDSMPDEIDPGLFSKKSFVLQFRNGADRLTYRGQLTAMTAKPTSGGAGGQVSSVPGPPGLLTLTSALGLGGLAFRRRKRRMPTA